MRRVLYLSIALTGCVADSSEAERECLEEKRCIPSVFKEEPSWRDVVGTVRRAHDGVPGATVRIEPGKNAPPLSALADSIGFFGFKNVAHHFDITASIGTDVITYRDVVQRFIDPAFPATPVPPRSWSAPVTISLEQPLEAGHAVAFFASGDGVYGVSGDLASGLALAVRNYTNVATIHAVEYEASKGLVSASAYGSVEVRSNPGATQLARIGLEKFDAVGETSVEIVAPTGFVPDPTVDVLIGYTLTCFAHVTSMPVGVKQKLPLIPNGIFTFRARATTPDGAISESGERGLDVYGLNTVELPEPPAAVTPLDGETRGPGESLFADVEPRPRGPGVFEHVFQAAPGSSGATVRVVTANREVALPDVSAVSASASGAYTWTVRNYPNVRIVEGLGGVNARRFEPFAQAKPRAITLR